MVGQVVSLDEEVDAARAAQPHLAGQPQIHRQVLIEIQEGGVDWRKVPPGPERVDQGELRRDVAHPDRDRQARRTIALGLAVAVEVDARLHRKRGPAEPADDAADLQVPRQLRRAGDSEIVAVAALLISRLLRCAHGAEVVLVVVHPVTLAECQRIRHLDVVGAADARPELRFDRVVPARGAVPHHLDFAEIGDRPRIAGADGASRGKVLVVRAQLLQAEIVDVIDVEGRSLVDLPADAGGRVPGVRQHVVVLDEEERSRAARRDVVGEALAAQHRADVGVELHQVRIGDEHGRPERAILGRHLEVLTVPRRVPAEARAPDHRTVPCHVPDESEPRLEVPVVVSAIRRHELVQVRVQRIVQQRVGVVDKPEVGVEMVPQTEVQADSVGDPPRVLDEGVGRLRIERPVAGRLHREGDGVGFRVARVKRQVGRELEVASLEEMRVVFVMGVLDITAELEIVARRVDVERVEDLIALARKILRHRGVLSEIGRRAGDAQVEAVRHGAEVVVHELEPQTVHPVVRQDRVVLRDQAVHVAVVVDLTRIRGHVRGAGGVLIVVGPSQEERVAVVEAVIDFERGHRVARPGRKLAVVGGGERVGGGQADDLYGAQVVVLVRSEEMRPVADDRPTHGAADPRLAELGLRPGREIIRRVERLVAAEIRSRAAEQVPAGLGNDRDHGRER